MDMEDYIIKMEIQNMMGIIVMISLKEMENIFIKMVNIIQVHLKMVQEMEKEYYFIIMEILNMMVILIIINMKEMEFIFMKMVIIIQVNLKKV